MPKRDSKIICLWKLLPLCLALPPLAWGLETDVVETTDWSTSSSSEIIALLLDASQLGLISANGNLTWINPTTNEASPAINLSGTLDLGLENAGGANPTLLSLSTLGAAPDSCILRRHLPNGTVQQSWTIDVAAQGFELLGDTLFLHRGGRLYAAPWPHAGGGAIQAPAVADLQLPPDSQLEDHGRLGGYLNAQGQPRLLLCANDTQGRLLALDVGPDGVCQRVTALEVSAPRTFSRNLSALAAGANGRGFFAYHLLDTSNPSVHIHQVVGTQEFRQTIDPVIDHWELLTDGGQLQLRHQLAPGVTAQIQHSGDLQSWTPVQTVTGTGAPETTALGPVDEVPDSQYRLTLALP